MIILGLLLVISIYVLVERSIVTYKASRCDENFMKRIKDYIHDGEIESALNLCKATGSPYSRLIAKGITRIGRPNAVSEARVAICCRKSIYGVLCLAACAAVYIRSVFENYCFRHSL